jgi:RimJ/RimL family protein N-acetyltransferase
MNEHDNNQPLFQMNGRYLCPLEREHLPMLKKWRNQQMRFLRQHTPLTSFHQEQWYPKAMNDDSQVLFSILLSKSDKSSELIGYCGIVYIDLINRRGEISFLVSPERASDRDLYRVDFLSVLFMLCEFGFEQMGLNRLYAETFSFRKEHMEILEEFGFVREGKMRKHVFADGKYHDSLFHSLLMSEWSDQKESIEDAVGR